MARLLRPVARQRRARFRLTWATILVAFAAVVLLARGDRIRAPFSEREADLALAAQPARIGANLPDGESGEEWPWTPATTFIASLPAQLLTSGERHMRLPGVLAGVAALALGVVLGERLFATRVGLLAASLLLLLPPAASFLGGALGPEPLFLLATIASLAAIRDFDESRRSGWIAGVAAGVAIAVGGSDGLWLPAFALAWLWANQGLTVRSVAAVGTGTALGATAATLVPLLLLGGPVDAAGLADRLAEHQVAGLFADPWATARSLVPFVPLVALGIGQLPVGWKRNASLRFILGWLLFSLAALRFGGSGLPAWVAGVFLAASLVVWGLAHASRRTAATALAATVLLARVLPPAPPPAIASSGLERWAARETGRFVRRTVPAERRVAGVTAVDRRLAFYGRRPVARLESLPGEIAGDYAVLDAARFRAMVRDRDGRKGDGPRMVAQFGPWAIVRNRPAEPPGVTGEEVPAATGGGPDEAPAE